MPDPSKPPSDRPADAGAASGPRDTERDAERAAGHAGGARGQSVRGTGSAGNEEQPAGPLESPGALPLEPAAERQPRRGRLWKLAVSLALLALLAWSQDLSGIWSIMRRASPAWLAAAAGVMFVEQTLTAINWGMLLRARGLLVGLGRVVHIFYLSFFLGTWLPSSSGADFVRAWYLARHVSGYEAVGSMLLLRFISLFAFGLFAAAGILALPANVPVEALLLALLLLLGSAGALLIGFTERPRRWTTAVLDAVGLHALARIIGKLHDALHAYREAPGALGLTLGICLLVQFMRILTVYWAGLALGATLPLLDYLVLVPVTALITLIPVSLSGLGVREGSFVWFFGRAGMDEATAFGLGLLVFGLSLVLWIVGAMLYWRERP